jgi:molecular chaperone GrpE
MSDENKNENVENVEENDQNNADPQAEQNNEEASTQETRQEQNGIDELTARIKELEDENSDLKDKFLRKQADIENFRKRLLRDKQDAIDFANKQLLGDIVLIIDDFERAIKSAEESKDFDSFHDGIVLIEKQFTGMLERKWGLKRFDSEGEEFDPQKHEAVMTEESDDHEEAVVLEDFQKGYMLHDKVLRSAKVKVSVPPQPQASGEGTE